MSPPETSADDQVQCPHCAATFTLNNAVEVSLPKLIRVQQKRQKSDAIIHDTAQDVPWDLWTDLVVDETSLDDIPVGQPASHLSDHEVHHIERAPHDDASFQANVTPTGEASEEDDDDDGSLFDFVIEGEEASKIFSKQELELAEAEEKTTSDSKQTFDLAFDEALLTEDQKETQEETDGKKSADPTHDMFDFEAEAGELEPGEFEFDPTSQKPRTDEAMEIPLAKTEEKPQPSTPPRRDPRVAVAVSRIGSGGKQKNRTQQAALVGIAGIFLLAVLYYGLNFFGGPQFNLLGIDLPGCADTSEEDDDTKITTKDPLSLREQSKRDLAKNLAKLQSDINSPEDPKLHPTTVYHPIDDKMPNDQGTSAEPENTNQANKHRLYTDPELLIPGGFNHDRTHSEFQLPSEGVGFVNYPLYDVRELEANLNATHEEFGCAECQSTGYLSRTMTPGSDVVQQEVECDICNGTPPNLMTMQGYRYFCQLGQAVTLFNDDSPRGIEAKHQVDELLKKTVETEREYSELGQLTFDKLSKPFNLNEGIMITGEVRIVKPNNGLYGAIIGVPGFDDTKITVISDKPFDFVAYDRVVLVGVVILDPAKNIAGFTATKKPWVIWYGTSINLPETLSN